MVDTNVFTGALLRKEGHNRRLLRAFLEGRLQPLMGQTLFLEYEDVLGREAIYGRSPLPAVERRELWEAFLGVCEWVHVYYLWRPNLRDEGDNHVLELAVAGCAEAIVTHNAADFRLADLRFPDVRIVTPKDYLSGWL